MPLGSMVYTTHTFVKKLTAENFERKSVWLTMEQFFSEIQNYAMEWCHHKKMNKGFLNLKEYPGFLFSLRAVSNFAKYMALISSYTMTGCKS